MLVHHRVTPSIKFAGTHLYTWVERGTVRVKCLAQEHNTMSPARAQTRSARSGVESTNHEATAPPQLYHVKTPASKQPFTCTAYVIKFCSHCHSMQSNWMASYVTFQYTDALALLLLPIIRYLPYHIWINMHSVYVLSSCMHLHEVGIKWVELHCIALVPCCAFRIRW